MLIMQRVIFVNIFFDEKPRWRRCAYIIEFKGEYIRNKLK